MDRSTLLVKQGAKALGVTRRRQASRAYCARLAVATRRAVMLEEIYDWFTKGIHMPTGRTRKPCSTSCGAKAALSVVMTLLVDRRVYAKP